MSTPTPGGSIDSQIRQLASQLNQPALSFNPSTMRKGTVTAISYGDSATPPTLTVLLSGDTTTPISGVYMASNYSPQIGDTVVLTKQGNEFFASLAIATTSTGTGWQTANLSSGNTHNGNGNGDLMYRKVMDNGAWKMQWKGDFAYGGSSSILASALSAEYRPSSKCSMVTARETQSGAIAVGVDFQTNGTISIIAENISQTDYSHVHFANGGTTGTDGSHAHSGDSGGSTGSAGSHAHGYSGSDTTSRDHSHPANSPAWIAFTGLEYFL